jgi:hypothetical protein
MFGPLGRLLVGGGLALIAAGLLFLLVDRLGMSRLPGDISIQRGRFTFFFPIVTCLLLSVVVSIIMTLLARWRR